MGYRNDKGRNHRNALLRTIYPPSKDVVAHQASQTSRPSLLRQSLAALRDTASAPAPATDERDKLSV